MSSEFTMDKICRRFDAAVTKFLSGEIPNSMSHFVYAQVAQMNYLILLHYFSDYYQAAFESALKKHLAALPADASPEAVAAAHIAAHDAVTAFAPVPVLVPNLCAPNAELKR